MFFNVIKASPPEMRPITSRQVSTSKTTKSDVPETPAFKLRTWRHNEQASKDYSNEDRRNLQTPRVGFLVQPSSDEMGKKNLTISQMCSFYRTAGLTTVEQNTRQCHNSTIQNQTPFRNKGIDQTFQLGSAGNFRLNANHANSKTPSSYGSSAGSSIQGSERNKKYKKEDTMFFRDEALKRIKEASSVYLHDNRVFHEQRMKRLENAINSQQRLKFERQLTETRKEFTDQLKRNVTNLAELKKVRKRYWKEKQQRVNKTYVSVAALEMPEVDRYAYGLPAEGKEYTNIRPANSAEVKEKLMKKWESSKKKASAIVKMLDMTKKLRKSKTLPMLKPLTSHGSKDKKVRINEAVEEPNEPADRISEIKKELSAVKAFMDISSEISSIAESSESEFDDDEL